MKFHKIVGWPMQLTPLKKIPARIYYLLLLLIVLPSTLIYEVNQCIVTWCTIQTTPPATRSKSQTEKLAEMIHTLPQKHLFGRKETIDPNTLPDSTLPIQVVGIMQPDSALLSIDQQPPRRYRIGDHLPDGVIVQEITKNHVILDHHGRLEKITLRRE